MFIPPRQLILTYTRTELLFIVLFRSLRELRSKQLQKLALVAQEQAKKASPVLLK